MDPRDLITKDTTVKTLRKSRLFRMRVPYGTPIITEQQALDHIKDMKDMRRLDPKTNPNPYNKMSNERFKFYLRLAKDTIKNIKRKELKRQGLVGDRMFIMFDDAPSMRRYKKGDQFNFKGKRYKVTKTSAHGLRLDEIIMN